MDCLFCKLIAGEIPSTKIYEDEKILCFKDIAPQTDVHLLVTPKEHICCANAITSENSGIVAYIFEKIPEIAKSVGITDYRIINNCGEGAGQTVKHLHFHILSGPNLNEKLV